MLSNKECVTINFCVRGMWVGNYVVQLELGKDIARLFQQAQVYKNLILSETAIHNDDIIRFQKIKWGIVLYDVLKLLLPVANDIYTWETAESLFTVY